MEAAAAVGSLASVGFKAAGQYESAAGTAAGDTFKAQQLDRAAEYGKLQALQVGGQKMQELATRVGNVDATRAAMNTDPTSPTGVALKAGFEKYGREAMNIDMDNILEQSRQQEADAKYMRSAASSALLAGKLSAAGTIAGGFASGMSSSTFGMGSLGLGGSGM